MTHIPSGLMTGVNSFFQATGKSVYSSFVAIVRQIGVRIPAALLLSTLGTVQKIWWSWPLSELVSDVLFVVQFLYAFKKVRQSLLEEPRVEVG